MIWEKEGRLTVHAYKIIYAHINVMQCTLIWLWKLLMHPRQGNIPIAKVLLWLPTCSGKLCALYAIQVVMSDELNHSTQKSTKWMCTMAIQHLHMAACKHHRGWKLNVVIIPPSLHPPFSKTRRLTFAQCNIIFTHFSSVGRKETDWKNIINDG